MAENNSRNNTTQENGVLEETGREFLKGFASGAGKTIACAAVGGVIGFFLFGPAGAIAGVQVGAGAGAKASAC